MTDDRPARQPDNLSIPRSFFDRDVVEVRDIAQLKVLMTVYRLIDELDSSLGMVPEELVVGDPVLRRGLRHLGSAREPLEAIRRGIELALARDALLRFVLRLEEGDQHWLMPSTPENRARLARLGRGEEWPPDVTARIGQPTEVLIERPNIFRLYEQNIGIVTPIIADQLIEALEIYPEAWIEEAIAEAVSYNRRQWRYVQRVLDRWATEGRGHEADRRHHGAAGAVDPEKYLRGKYASLFRRRR